MSVPQCADSCGCKGQSPADQCWADPFCPECSVFGNNFTEEEAVGTLKDLGFQVEPTQARLEEQAQLALEGQLRLTVELVNNALGEHHHFDDDCGDYLAAALRLSGDLATARLSAPAVLVDTLRELAADDPTADPDWAAGRSVLALNYASDGVSGEVWAFLEDELGLTPEVQ